MEPANEQGGDDADPDSSDENDALDESDDASPDQAGDDAGDAGDAEHAVTLAEWFGGKPLHPRAHLVAGLLTPLFIAIANMWRLKSFTIDDAYISYRYARNFARGMGLVYNPGERIEGYTNFLWTVLLGFGAKLGVDPTVTAKVLGFTCGLACVALVYHIESQVRPLTTVPALSPFLLATTTAFMGYSIFGLETPLFGALVLGGVALMMREEKTDGMPWSALAFGAAALTRPEAPMFLGLMMLFLPGARLVRAELAGLAGERRPGLMLLALTTLAGVLYLRLGAPADDSVPLVWLVMGLAAVAVVSELPVELLMPRNLVRGGVFVAIVAALALWRKSYYGGSCGGGYLANTLCAKTGDLHQQMAGGLDYLKKYGWHEGPLLAFPLLGIGVAIAQKHRHLLAFAAICVCSLVYIVLVGGDWMPMFRFATAQQPFLYLLAAVGVRAILEERKATINWGLLIIASMTCLFRATGVRDDRDKILSEEKAFWDRAAGGVASWFAETTRRHGREAIAGPLALGDIGQVGYDTDLPIVDLLGLVDPVVAKLPGGYTNKIGPGFRDYFFTRRPRYFILISAQNDCHHPSVSGSIALYRDPRFHESYSVSGRVMLTGGFSWCVYERTDLRDVSRPVLVLESPGVFKSDSPVPQ